MGGGVEDNSRLLEAPLESLIKLFETPAAKSILARNYSVIREWQLLSRLEQKLQSPLQSPLQD